MSVAPGPELDAEREVDLRRYGSALALRWWLPLLGVVAGIALGYALTLGGDQVYRAQALVYLGQTLSPAGTSQVQSLGTNPSAVREIASSEAAVRRAARESGLRPQVVRSNTFVQVPTGQQPRAAGGQATLVNVGLTGPAPRRVADAANALAAAVVEQVSGYAEQKIEALSAQVASSDEELASIEERIEATLAAAEEDGISTTERLVALTNAGILEQRRATVLQSRFDRAQLLTLARQVERPRVVTAAVPRQVTAQSPRNTVVAAAFLGLLLGIVAALVWDAAARRRVP